MPPVRLVQPAVEAGEPEQKSLQEWLAEEETVQGWHFCDREEEGLNAEHRSITRCTFRHVRFTDCRLSSTHLMDVRFEHCDLSNARLPESSLMRVEFIDCKLVGTDLSESTLQHLLLKDCNARYLNLSMNKLSQVRLTGCDLREAYLDNCKFSAVALEQCDLMGADFTRTSLRGIDLRTSHIEALRLNLPDIRGAIVDTVQAMELVRLLGVVVE